VDSKRKPARRRDCELGTVVDAVGHTDAVGVGVLALAVGGGAEDGGDLGARKGTADPTTPNSEQTDLDGMVKATRATRTTTVMGLSTATTTVQRRQTRIKQTPTVTVRATLATLTTTTTAT
jgi:hypothetical protein